MQQPTAFELVVPTGSIVLLAPDADDREEWVQHLYFAAVDFLGPSQGANPFWIHTYRTGTLHSAAFNGDLREIAALLALREGFDMSDDLVPMPPCADLNILDLEGSTALHLAAAQGHWEAVNRLVGAGANATVVDLQGRLPLHLAASVRPLPCTSPPFCDIVISFLFLGHRLSVARHAQQHHHHPFLPPSLKPRNLALILFVSGCHSSLSSLSSPRSDQVLDFKTLTSLASAPGGAEAINHREFTQGRTAAYVAAIDGSRCRPDDITELQQCITTLMAWGANLDLPDSKGVSAVHRLSASLDAAPLDVLLHAGASASSPVPPLGFVLEGRLTPPLYLSIP